MAFTQDDRITFADLMDELSSEATAHFLDAHSDQLVAEAGARPGVDQVRAGLLRALSLHDRPELPEAQQAARHALTHFADDVAGAPPTLLQRRHPAWVGLCALELGLSRDEALSLARVGFESIAGPQGDGDLLWAMAEAADEVDWSTRQHELLEAALTAEFQHRTQHDQVRLLWALQRVESHPEAADELAALGADVDADDRARVHALWVVAALHRRNDAEPRARDALLAALALVDEDDEPEIAQRIREALAG
jgi:hypothetical protein